MSDLDQELEAALQSMRKEPDPRDPLLSDLRDTIHRVINKLIPLLERPRRVGSQVVPGVPQHSIKRQCEKLRKRLDERIAEQKAAYEKALKPTKSR